MTAPQFFMPLQERLAHSDSLHEHGSRNRIPAAVLQRLLQSYGTQSSSYFSVQPDCHHYYQEGLGVVSYYPVHGLGARINLVFNNPLASRNNLDMLIAAFEHDVPGQTLYVGVDAALAEYLADRGHRTTIMGSEFCVDLEQFSLRGKAMKQLRHAANLNRRARVEVHEASMEDVDTDSARAISLAWRQKKAVNQRELRLLTRPPEYRDEWGVRKFFAYHNGALVGYVFFDPYFENGRIKGYTANILREACGSRLVGLLDFIIIQAAEQFKAEGVAELSLGIAPLHGMRPHPNEQPWIRRLGQLTYAHGNRLYAFRDLAYHKSRYRGRETPWFICSREIGALRSALALLSGTGVLGRSSGRL